MREEKCPVRGFQKMSPVRRRMGREKGGEGEGRHQNQLATIGTDQTGHAANYG